jgi:hypothetical protein
MNKIYFVQATSTDHFKTELAIAENYIASINGSIIDIKPVGVSGNGLNYAVIIIYCIYKP